METTRCHRQSKSIRNSLQRELDLVLVGEKQIHQFAELWITENINLNKKKSKRSKKKSHQTEVKEVKMRYKIDKHDYDVRIGQAMT